MNKNHMEEVAKMLGVEMYEPFNILFNGAELRDGPFALTDETLEDKRKIHCAITLVQLLNGSYTIKRPILNEKEKAYLGGVLRPFKDRVNFVTKFENSCEEEYINIGIEGDENINFPNFKANTMYKGMKLYEHYTLKELGLFE